MIPIIFIAIIDTLIAPIPQAAHIDERYGQEHDIEIHFTYDDTLIAVYPDIFDSIHCDTIAHKEIYKNEFSIRCRFRHSFDVRPPYAGIVIDTILILHKQNTGASWTRFPGKPIPAFLGAPDNYSYTINGRLQKGAYPWRLILNFRSRKIIAKKR